MSSWSGAARGVAMGGMMPWKRGGGVGGMGEEYGGEPGWITGQVV
jgi:hypothetical protein